MVSRRSILLSVPLATAALAAPYQPSASRAASRSGRLASSPGAASLGAAPSGATPFGATPSGATDLVRVAPQRESVAAAAAAVRGFTVDLYRAMASSGGAGNLACAPYSVVLALAMTRAGAGGTTASEMDAVLHAPTPRPGALDGGLNSIDQLLLANYRDGDGVQCPRLTTASALWPRLGLDLRSAFQDTLAGFYGAAVHPVDYLHAPEASRQEINAWVSDRTNARIPQLLGSGSVRSDTSLILTNAIYLKAAWFYPFAAKGTAMEPFTRDDGVVVDAPMMRGPFDTMGYLEGDGWRAVDVPYAGGDLAMAVVMPTRGTLAGLEASLDAAWLGALLLGFRYVPVQLRLPRWTLRVPVKLRAVLAGLGMPTAFTDRADFSGISADQGLRVDDVVHETFVAVDEKGTEAAGASAVIIRPPSIPKGPSFFVDRPFLFVIHEVTSGLPLFIGRVNDPYA